MIYRNPKLIEAVRALPCMECGAENGTVCAAHSNDSRHGRGHAHKSHDVFVAALCVDCHDRVDGRSGKLTKETKREVWQYAWEETMFALFVRGIVEVR